jgi:thiol-disulfide isomerase/thioredoxin
MKKLTFVLLFVLIKISAIAQTRVVLLEQFSNSGCPPCASSTPPIINYVNSNPNKIAAIVYHTPFPYLDSMYYENPTESDARVSFYGSFGVPYSILDGNYYRNNSSTLLNSLNNTVNTRAAVNTTFSISKNNISLVNRNLTGSIKFSSLSNNTSDDLAAFIVVVEKRVEKSDYKASPGNNSETYYSYVMRKFMTNVNGYTLTKKAMNEEESIPFTWTVENFKDLQELRIVAFVQNLSTKEVYQSVLFNPFETSTGITKQELNNEFEAYPNPSRGSVTIETKSVTNFKLNIYDTFDKLISSEHVNTNTYQIENLSTGIYIVQLITTEGVANKKIIIQ